MSTEPTRRAILFGGLAALAGAGGWIGCGRRDEAGRQAALALAAEVGLVAGAPELGRAYLELHPDEADAGTLMELLFDEPELDAMRSRLAERIGRDWIELETVQIDGWIVSRAEGRFLALVALLEEQAPER